MKPCGTRKEQHLSLTAYLLASASFSTLYFSASAGRLMVASNSRSFRAISYNIVTTNKGNYKYRVTSLKSILFLDRFSCLLCNEVAGSQWIVGRTHPKGTSSLGLRHLGIFWNLESQKWHFQGNSRGIFHRGLHVVSSECTQDWEQCCQNIPDVPWHRMVRMFHRAKPV